MTTGASVGGAVSLGADARVGALSVHTLAVAADPRARPAFVDVCHTHTQNKKHVSAVVALKRAVESGYCMKVILLCRYEIEYIFKLFKIS